MKLPPIALTAPSLCPRCDAPALQVDDCRQCALPLRQCGACLGVAGPFDRYCGFCGHELVLGRKRSRARRLWLLAGMVPIAAGLAIGLSPVGQQAVRQVASVRQGPAVRPTLTDSAVGFTAAAPGWTLQDLSRGGLPVAAMFSDPADAPALAGGPNALLSAKPAGVIAEAVRPSVTDPGVDPNDPVGVLAFETAQLLAAPPPGYSFATVSAVRAQTIGGRRAARSVLSMTSSGAPGLVLEKVYIAAPAGGLFLIEVVCPTSELSKVDAFVSSIRLTR